MEGKETEVKVYIKEREFTIVCECEFRMRFPCTGKEASLKVNYLSTQLLPTVFY